MVALSIYWIADIHFRNNDLEAAIVSYRAFLVSPASNALSEKTDVYYNLGYAYLVKDQLKDAINSFRIYLQSSPKNNEKIKNIAILEFLKSENAFNPNCSTIPAFSEIVLCGGHFGKVNE